MSIAFAQKTPNTSLPNRGGPLSALTTSTFGSSVAEGDIVVAVCTQYRTSACPAITFSDSKGNTWYVDKTQTYASGSEYGRTTIGHCIVAAGKGGTGFTVTATLASGTSEIDLGAYEYSGVDPSIGAGGSGNNSGTGTGTNLSSGQVTVSGNHVYVGGVCMISGAITPATGWTERHQDDSDVNANLDTEDKIDSGNQTATWTLNTSHTWAAACVAYKEAAASIKELRAMNRGISRGIARGMA